MKNKSLRASNFFLWSMILLAVLNAVSSLAVNLLYKVFESGSEATYIKIVGEVEDIQLVKALSVVSIAAGCLILVCFVFFLIFKSEYKAQCESEYYMDELIRQEKDANKSAEACDISVDDDKNLIDRVKETVENLKNKGKETVEKGKKFLEDNKTKMIVAASSTAAFAVLVAILKHKKAKKD